MDHPILRNKRYMKQLILPAVILFLISFGSCYYDSEEALYPSYDATCDTSNVTFSVSITDILNNSCWGCHSASTANTWGNKIVLVTHGEVTSQISKIIPSINHTGPYPMPKNSSRLLKCDLDKFDIWVRKGMPNN
jgi:hypothetical protein